jgi:hypothetical protein
MSRKQRRAREAQQPRGIVSANDARVTPSGRRIWLAIPAYTGSVTIVTLQSILHDVMKCTERGDTVRVFTEIGHADIHLLRAQIVARFLEDRDATHLVFVDSDVGWPPYCLPRLIDHDVDMVGGCYPKRTFPLSFLFRTAEAGKLSGDLETGLMDVTGLGGGFLCIKRHVLEQMVERYRAELVHHDPSIPGTEVKHVVRLFDPYWWTDPNGERRVLGEDYAFCQRWIDMDGQIYMDSAFAMAHVGWHTFHGSVGEHLEPKQQEKAA